VKSANNNMQLLIYHFIGENITLGGYAADSLRAHIDVQKLTKNIGSDEKQPENVL